MQDLVSIIVPVYNERQYLEMCVDSILKSTWSNIEIILVDDGSEKEVYDLCNRIALKNEKCRCIHQKNMGLSSARVAGFYASHGEWITFVDNDDVVSPFLVEKLIGEIGEDIDIIMGQRIDTETPEKIDWIKETVQSQTYDGKTVCTMIAHDPEQKRDRLDRHDHHGHHPGQLHPVYPLLRRYPPGRLRYLQRDPQGRLHHRKRPFHRQRPAGV